MNEPLDYRTAGVNLETYAETISRIGPHLRRTYTPRVIDWKNGFAGLFRLDDQIGLLSRAYRDPVLVASTDGVGTKLKLAFATGRHRTVGIDLVAMSVNDCLCAGAEPLFFLDYVAMSRDDPELTSQIVGGISDACIESDCALLGGETAILPDFYKDGEYDLAGFCVGVVERKHVLNGSEIRLGDKVIGLASSGLHSNGYSLARKIVFEHAGLKPDTFVPELGRTVADELLEPTRLYVRAVKTVYRPYRVKRIVHGIAHITGGGLVENLPRIFAGRARDLAEAGFVDCAEGFPVAAGAGIGRNSRDGSRVQHGDRPGDRCRRAFCGGDRAAAQPSPQDCMLDHRGSGARRADGVVARVGPPAGVCKRCTELAMRVSYWVQLDAVYWWPPCEAVPVRWSDGIRLLD